MKTSLKVILHALPVLRRTNYLFVIHIGAHGHHQFHFSLPAVSLLVGLPSTVCCGGQLMLIP